MEGRRGFLRLWAWGVGAVIASGLRTELLVCLSICVLSDAVYVSFVLCRYLLGQEGSCQCYIYIHIIVR